MVVGAVVIAALLLFASGVFRPVTNAASMALRTIAAPLYSAGAAITRTAPNNAELELLRIENAKLKTLITENAALKASLAFKEREGDDTVLARVISRTNQDIFHGLLIDRGADDGIVIGQPVVLENGVIIGKIFEIRPRIASVLLLTDIRSTLAVSVENATETTGVLEGDRGLSMVLSLIPQTEKIANGDQIITSGIEPGVRRGLVVGTVEKVNKETKDPFQSAIIAPFRTAAMPTFVQILRTSVGQ